MVNCVLSVGNNAEEGEPFCRLGYRYGEADEEDIVRKVRQGKMMENKVN